MKLDVIGATVEVNGVKTATLHIVVHKNQCRGLADVLKKSPLQVEIVKKKKKRSLSANAYCWVLCEKIAQRAGTTKTEVYRDAIHERGVWDVYTNTEAAVARMEAIWPQNGVGWFTDRLETRGGSASAILYYGSSSYGTEEMARLLDYLIDEAESLGIDAATPNERSLLLEEWKHG